MKCLLITISLSLTTVFAAGQNIPGRQKIEPIGNLKLKSGKQINDCKIGYITFGKLNAGKSNAILFPTWFIGTAQQIATSVQPWHFIDTTRYQVIIADALANGISSSPSNSSTQHGAAFPAISIEDMVEAHHQLLVQKMGIRHIHAIIGTSMGAFQAYQWAVTYPAFTNRIIAIAGSPQLTGYDIIHMGIIIKAIDDNPNFNHGNYTSNPSIPLAMMELTLAATTPNNLALSISRQAVPNTIRSFNNSPSDWNNLRTQLTACREQDIARKYNGSLAQAARLIKAKMLLVNNKQDHLVNPLPAISFSKLLPAKLLLLDNAMGHNGIDYQDPTFKQYVKEFLNTNP